MEKQLKLFVWEEVFSDYTDGIAFALAENADEARDLILKKLREDYPSFTTKALDKEPSVITEKEGFYLFGGG